MHVRTQPNLRRIIAAAALLGLSLTFASSPPRSIGPRSNARPANRTRCGSASSTSPTLAVSGRACPITVATLAPPAAPFSRAARRRV
jgi:hypothetical protein